MAGSGEEALSTAMTKRVKRSPDGKYHVAGKKYTILKGSRAQVWHETAYKTAGGLKKSDLVMNKLGRVVSSKKHQTAKKKRVKSLKLKNIKLIVGG